MIYLIQWIQNITFLHVYLYTLFPIGRRPVTPKTLQRFDLGFWNPIILRFPGNRVNLGHMTGARPGIHHSVSSSQHLTASLAIRYSDTPTSGGKHVTITHVGSLSTGWGKTFQVNLLMRKTCDSQQLPERVQLEKLASSLPDVNG